MKKMIVGYTGFVGGNILEQSDFDYLINSKNIESAFGIEPDILIYSGVPAEMFIANKHPEKDREVILNAIENIKKINAKTVVLISTVAVYDRTDGKDEDHAIDEDALAPYGRNRLELEKWIENHCDSYLIVRLPAIFGNNLKKNFIYDLINYIPGMLNENKYYELSEKYDIIKASYFDMGNGFYKHKELTADVRKQLKETFGEIGFSALNFTDSRSVYQFFDLKYLYEAVEKCLLKGIKKINLVTPPLSTAKIYQRITGQVFDNQLAKAPFDYDLKTKYTDTGYIMSEEQELCDIEAFVSKHNDT